MPVIAIVNRKGGSGKSTLATHLAAWCAHQGMPVLLGDADFQQSSHAWLRQRERQRLAPAPKIAGWSVDPRNILRTPPGVTHVILDTPGGLKGYDLLRVVMLADAVLMPLAHSLFDRESAAECYTELLAHPRVARGRCAIAAVGMRIDARTKAEASLRQWAEGLQLRFLGALRETQTYVKCLEHGLTIFDMPAAKVEADLAQWRPIIEFVSPMLRAAPEPEARPAAGVLPKPAAKPAVHKPSRPVLPPGSRPSGSLRPLGVSAEAELTAARTGPGALDALPAEAGEPLAIGRAGHVNAGRSAVAGGAVNGSAINGGAVNGSAVNGSAVHGSAIEGGAGSAAGKAAGGIAADGEPAGAQAPTERPVNGSPVDRTNGRHQAPEAAEDLDSHFGGLTTRIGRWLESLSVKRAR